MYHAEKVDFYGKLVPNDGNTPNDELNNNNGKKMHHTIQLQPIKLTFLMFFRNLLHNSIIYVYHRLQIKFVWLIKPIIVCSMRVELVK